MNTLATKPVFAIIPGAGDLPKLALVAPDGARAEVYLHGAHVASWVPAGGQERLFLSRASQFSRWRADPWRRAVVFRSLAGWGPLPLHGLARLMRGSGPARRLRGSARPRSCACAIRRKAAVSGKCLLAELTVSTGGAGWPVTLAVTNTGAEPFAFTTGLHTYLAVADIATTLVEGWPACAIAMPRPAGSKHNKSRRGLTLAAR